LAIFDLKESPEKKEDLRDQKMKLIVVDGM
jgi:hypothetical protein